MQPPWRPAKARAAAAEIKRCSEASCIKCFDRGIIHGSTPCDCPAGEAWTNRRKGHPMTETDDLVERAREESVRTEGTDRADTLLDEMADKLEAQSRALTASQEAIDTLGEENERLRKALNCFAKGRHLIPDDPKDGCQWVIDRARAVLSN